MESTCAIVVLAVFLSAVFLLKSHLMKLAYGSCKGKNEMKSENPGRYPYRAILTIDGMRYENCARRVECVLAGIDGVQAEADISRRRAIVRMEREIDDDALRSAVESLGPYAVTKIERKRYV